MIPIPFEVQILATSCFLAGLATLYAPWWVSRTQGPLGRNSTEWWIRKFGYQSVMAGNRAVGGVCVSGAVLWVLTAAGAPLSLTHTGIYTLSISTGIPLGLWVAYRKEWPGEFASQHGQDKWDRVVLFLSVLKPGSPIVSPGLIPDSPSQYFPTGDTSDTSAPLFDTHPVSFGSAKGSFQFYSVCEGVLFEIILHGEFQLTTRKSGRDFTASSVMDSGDKEMRFLSDVSLSEDTTERLARASYETLAEQVGSGDLARSETLAEQVGSEDLAGSHEEAPPIFRSEEGLAVSIDIDEHLPIADEQRHVSAVRLNHVTSSIMTPTQFGAFSHATYHADMLGPGDHNDFETTLNQA